jgi:carbon storage regulator
MLRKTGESLVVGDDVVVTVLQFRGDGVRLAVEAPLHTAVLRKEVYEAVWREKPGPRPEPSEAGVEGPHRPTTLTLTEAQADDFEDFRREVSMRVRRELSTDQVVRLLFYALRANRFHNLQAAVQGQTGLESIPIPAPPTGTEEPR